MREIRVLVVDNSRFYRELLEVGLGSDPAIHVVGVARDPFEARDAIIELEPDVMTLEIDLPRMDGLEFLRKLMPQYPMPVIIVSAQSEKQQEAAQVGAVDFVIKPRTLEKVHLEHFIKQELPTKVKIASMVKMGKIKNSIGSRVKKNEKTYTGSPHQLIAIGASTGGTEAIADVIRGFDTDIPGVVVVQHMPPGFTAMYAKRLNDQNRVCVREAVNGDRVEPGLVLIAPGGDAHMSVKKTTDGTYQVEIKKGEKVNGHCPSVDVLFDSVAKSAGKNAIGIILTGMGADGAQGILQMRRAGAHTIGQDETTCVVYGMPKVAYDLGAIEYQEKLTDISKRTYQIINKM